MPDQFPDEVSVDKRIADGAVRMTFGWDGHPDQAIFVDQPRLLHLIGSLTEQIESGPVVPMSKRDIQPGSLLRQESVGFRRQPNGAVRATFGVTFEDRYVTLAFDLDGKMIDDLIQEAGR